MVYLYLRVSTDKQTTDTQEFDLLRKFPDGTVYRETASGIHTRPVLRKLIELAKPGDTIAITALDRMGRKLKDILAMLEVLEKKQVNIISLREGIDYRTPVGKLVTQMIGAVSELERTLISQRTSAALQTLKAKGVRLGRPSIYTADDMKRLFKLQEEGLNYKQINEATGISMGMISSVLGTRRPKKDQDAA